MCDKNCHNNDCPFALTEISEMAQNYGCLPTPQEIINMRVIHGKTWACHSDPTKPCVGGIKALKKAGFDHSVIDKVLITELNLTKDILN